MEVKKRANDFYKDFAARKKYFDQQIARMDCKQILREAYEEGFQEGFKEGFDEGFKEGIEEGRRQAREKIVLNMLKEKWDLAVIADLLNIPLDEAKDIAREHGYA